MIFLKMIKVLLAADLMEAAHTCTPPSPGLGVQGSVDIHWPVGPWVSPQRAFFAWDRSHSTQPTSECDHISHLEIVPNGLALGQCSFSSVSLITLVEIWKRRVLF
jgi:hypothetical protein